MGAEILGFDKNEINQETELRMSKDTDVVPDMKDFTRVPNVLLEPGLTDALSGLQLRVLLTILRGTLGWGRKSMLLRVAGMARELNVTRANVQKAIKVLQAANLIEIFTRSGCIAGDAGVHRTQCRYVSLAMQVFEKSVSLAMQHNKDSNIKISSKERDQDLQSSDGKTDPYRLITRGDVAGALKQLSAVLVIPNSLGGELTEAMIDSFWSAVRKRGWGVLRLRELCRIARQTCRYFPTLSDLLDIANQNPGAGKRPETPHRIKPEEMATEEEFQQAMAELKKVINF
jgi:phage replication O-like protein O